MKKKKRDRDRQGKRQRKRKRKRDIERERERERERCTRMNIYLKDKLQVDVSQSNWDGKNQKIHCRDKMSQIIYLQS